MVRFRDVSIRRKLLLINVFTTGIALMLASTAFISYERVRFEQDVTRQLSTVADVTGANAQIGCITMEPGALDRVYTGEELTDEEKKTFASHPAAGGELLSRIPRLEGVAQVVAVRIWRTWNNRRWRDISRMRRWRREPSCCARPSTTISRLRAADPTKKTLDHMRRHAEQYALACLNALARFASPEGGMEVRVLKSAELCPSMIVAQDVRAKNGLLLLAKGQEVTLSVLGRLKSFAAKVAIAEPMVLVGKPETVSSPGAVDGGGRSFA